LYEAVEACGVSVQDFTPTRALRGGYDLWHLHWPDDFLSYPSPITALVYVVAELVLMALARQRGTRVVWTIHDLGPHESPHPWLERLFWPLFLPMVDGFITLSEHARQDALDRFPILRSVPGTVVPHGHYRPAYPDPMTKEAARGEWRLPPEGPTAVFIGRIRPYKNVVPLVRTFRQLDTDAHLLVAGNPSDDTLADHIRTAAEGAERIHLALRFIPEKRLPSVVAAADLVVLPYEDILHSGSALLALSFNRPVLVPAQGAMGELQSEVGEEWVYTYEGDLTPDMLDARLQAARADDRAAEAPLDHLSWKTLAEQTVDLYETVLSS
jgi:glycosyltransferase involved in cell wall biosynthesis